MLFDSLPDNVRDPLYVAIGLPVVAAQEARTASETLLHELEARLAPYREQLEALGRRAADLIPSVELPDTPSLDTLNARVEARVKVIEERVSELEDRIDEVLDRVEGQLPDSAADVFAQARGAAREARTQLRSLVSRAA